MLRGGVSVDEDSESDEHDWLPNFGNSRAFIETVTDGLSPGSIEQPTLILEVGGGKFERPYPQQTLSSKNIVVGNIDYFPEWGDRQQQCDLNRLNGGLNDSELGRVFENTQLGAVVISHVLKFLEPDAAKAIIDSAIERLIPGGKIVVLDMSVSSGSAEMMRKVLNKHSGDSASEGNGADLHDFMYRRILRSFRHLESIGQEQGFRFSRYALGLAVPERVSRKVSYHRQSRWLEESP